MNTAAPTLGAVNRGTRLTLAICAASALFEGFDNQSMGVAAPVAFRELAVSSAQAGFVFSAATFGLFIGAAVGGRVADHIGRKPSLAVALILFGIGSLATATVHSSQALLILRFLTGLGLGGAMPNFIALASEAVDPRRRLGAVTLIMAALPLGGALSGLMALGGSLGWGWRSIFVVGGVAPLMVGATLLLADREARTRPHSSSVAGCELKVDKITTVLWGQDRASTTALLWVGFLCTQLVLFLMVNWLPSLIIGLGFTRPEASLAAIAFNVTGGVGAGFLGRLHAGPRRRLWVSVTYGGIAASLLALVAVASAGREFWLALLACSVVGLFIVGAQLILFALAPLYYAQAIRGTGVGAAVAVGRLGTVIGPLYAAVLLAGGGASGTVLLAIVPFVVIGGSAALALAARPQSAD